ncbi:MAG: DUF4908 domain-containing protein [Proteobacteria bacterium]|nr:DUF4908 domain-containing protein [Pseudomonadota bacterium]
MKKRFTFIVATALQLAFASFAQAQSNAPLAERIEQERLGDVQPGAYLAGDTVKFTLDSANGVYLLRFEGMPEVFVLYSDNGTLGGRLLKYDSGETAMRVASWGAITLYTDQQPNGLPAVRTGDSMAPSPPTLSLGDMQNAAEDETQHLSYVRRLRLAFSADWNALGNNAGLRALTYDAMENTARGVERFAAAAASQKNIAKRIDSVLITIGNKPTLAVKGKTLIVTFNAAKGYTGRASSRAIARALEKVLPAQKD